MDVILAGIDFGYIQPTIITIVKFDQKKSYVVEEFYQAGLTITEIISECKNLTKKHGIELFFADPSQPAYINKMNREGIHAVSAKKPKYISDGMNIILEKLKHEELDINRSCSRLTSEFLVYDDIGRIDRGMGSLIYVFYTLADIPKESLDVPLFKHHKQ
jgi:phage terminase large subunit